MVSIDKIEKVVEILQHVGRLRKNELVNRLMNEADISKETAWKTINEAEESGKIKRENRRKGKAPMVLYTIHFDIEENEKNIFDMMEKRLKEFDNRFIFFEGVFSRLDLEEKKGGIGSFMMLHLLISSSVHSLWNNFGQTNEWKKLLEKVQSRNPKIYELIRTCPLEEGIRIHRDVMEEKIQYIDEFFNVQRKNLKEIERKYSI